MSEELLRESIVLYESQLEQVNISLEAIANVETENKDDLLQLKNDLQQLIDLTRDNLLELKKKEALKAADNYLKDICDDDKNLESPVANVSSTSKCTTLDEDLQNLVGMKCQAPYGDDWQQFGYHNALIIKIDATDVSDVSSIKATVLYCNPVYKKMLPCPYYLEGNCKFSDSDCRQSHGAHISLSQLKEYQDPDFSLLAADVRCLAKTDHGLWTDGIVHKVIDERTCRVYLKSFKEYVVLNWEDILPLVEEEDGEESEEEEDYENIPNLSTADDVSLLEDFKPSHVWKMSPSSQLLETPLGTWEKHTKGIGSKLLFQMGYVLGQGLGKEQGGRLEPVEAVVYPKGKSLDHCMELKEKGEDINKKRRRRRRNKTKKRPPININAELKRPRSKLSVFDFLNDKLLHRKKDDQEKPSEINVKLNNQSLKGNTSQKLNVHSFQIGESIKRTEKDISKLKEALKRNKARNDVITIRRIEKTINEKHIELENLKKSEQAVRNEQISRSNAKKLSIF